VVHGLGTQAGAQMVPEAHVTFFDTKTLSVPEGWHVEAAAHALKAGWPLSKILALLEKIRDHAQGIYTLNTLKYLIHGGRISHLKGLLASMLNIKPVIGVGKEDGKYVTLSQEVTMKRAIHKVAGVLSNWYPHGSKLRIQLLHGDNLDGVDLLRQFVAQLYDCKFEPVTAIAPVLGAHTGPGLVGLSAAPQAVFPEIF
jgi:DegV family protein with EDD domain